MDNYRTEINIPVSRDKRTFEQRRKDMLSKLERSYRSESSVPLSESTISGSHRRLNDWDDEVNRWISDTRSKWSEDMKRMRQSMFALEPVDDFDLDHWGNFEPIHSMDDPSTMMEQMERRMESLRQKMGSMSSFGPSHFSGPNSSTMQTSSSRVISSTSHSSGNDPKNMVTKSNVVESSQHSRTVDGETTTSSSHSSSSSNTSGLPGSKINITNTPGTLLPQTSVPCGMMDFLKDAYELGDDGKVHFKVRFDAKDFAPEDIEVTTVDNHLRVHAKKSIKSGSTTTEREFRRSIDLPRSIDHEHFQCHLTEDGVLILDAPVKAPDYQSITFQDHRQLGIRPRAESEIKATPNSNKTPVCLTVTGRSGPTIMKDGINGRKLHLEVTVDSIYKADELCVRMDSNCIVISGCQKKTEGSSSSTAEFTQSFEIPETVDPFSVTAQLIGTTLVVEAPLLCTV
ncbi:Major egg antigen [Schistosoma japonicum]|nr:Major egg antigen [Schistosoma japonicum]